MKQVHAFPKHVKEKQLCYNIQTSIMKVVQSMLGGAAWIIRQLSI